MRLMPLNELFEVSYGNKLDLNKMTPPTPGNEVAFVNRTGRSNGVVALVARLPTITPYDPGILTVALGGSILATFLQTLPFYTGQNVAVAKPRTALTKAELLFYAMAIGANKFRYGAFGREANRSFRSILVPHPDEIPSWVSGANVAMYQGKDAPLFQGAPLGLDPTGWHPFRLGELFDIKKGKRLTSRQRSVGSTPYIGAIESNNGVSAFIGQEAIHEGNTISVSYNGSVAEAFYQPESFWATDDVNVLYPRFPLTPEVALFICAIIRREKYRFNYGRKWHLSRMRATLIRLPADDSGVPDWRMMTDYIQRLPFSSCVASS